MNACLHARWAALTAAALTSGTHTKMSNKENGSGTHRRSWLPLPHKHTDHKLMRHCRASRLRSPAVSPPPQLPRESLPQTRRSCGSAVQRGAQSPGGTPQRAEAGPGLPAERGPTPPPRRASVLPPPTPGAGAPRCPARSLSPPAASPMRTRRCLRRVRGSLRVSSTFCVDFRTSPCGFLENIPPGPAPAPRSRGGERPPDPPAPGPYIAGGGAASFSCWGRSAAGRGGRSADSPQARGWPGPGLPPSSFPRSPPAASRQPSGATPGVTMATAP